MSFDLSRALDNRGRKPGAALQAILGRVVSSAGASVTVRLSDGSQITAPRLRAYSNPAAGDTVLLLKSGSSVYALGALNAGAIADPGVDATQPPPPEDVTTQTFRPLSTGTWRGAAWRADTTNLVQGDSTGEGLNYGAAYYGAAPSSLGQPDLLSGSVRIKRNAGGSSGAQTPTLQLLAEEERPDAQPRSIDTLEGPALAIGDEASVDLPLSWLDALCLGTAGGIGISVPNAAPYIVLAGASAWAPAFELSIRYREA